MEPDSMNTDIVRSRVDPDLKRQAGKVLKEMGLTFSDAVRLMLIRVVEDRALPFALRAPNPVTEAALASAERGEGARFTSVSALMADLTDDAAADDVRE
jgi:DNA-damage-inducible protein J